MDDNFAQLADSYKLKTFLQDRVTLVSLTYTYFVTAFPRSLEMMVSMNSKEVKNAT